MRFYTKTHQHYCGIDLHARTMYVCILNAAGVIVVHRNIRTDQTRFLVLIAPYRDIQSEEARESISHSPYMSLTQRF
jgi:hypothetical protein